MNKEPLLLAVDPGSSSGALAWLTIEGGATKVTVHNMPDSYAGIWNLLQGLAATHDITTVMEDVGGSMPGNAAKAARTFAAHVGALEMAFVALGREDQVVKVRPQKWMPELFGDKYPKAEKGADAEEKRRVKQERKHFIHDEVLKLLGDLGTCTLRQADAVALLFWGRMHLEGKKI